MIEMDRKSNILFYRILVACLAASLMLHSCYTSNSKESNESDIVEQIESSVSPATTVAIIEQIEQKETIDIPVAVNLAHTDDEYLMQFNPAEYVIIDENDDEIFIDNDLEYYRNYMSGHRFIVPRDNILCTEEIEYLTMNLDIVNNTNTTLNINELDIFVEESTPDTIPFIYIRTSNDRSNMISFINGSWFNWEGFTFMYRVLRKGETFDGNYNKSKHFTYFEDYCSVDLLPDMKELGYDFDGLLERKEISVEYNDYLNDGSYIVFPNIWNAAFIQQAFSPFDIITNSWQEEEGFAMLYGSIQFDCCDTKVDFIAEVSLFGRDFGAVSYANDSFDVLLKSSGTNYEMRYPYSTIIEPYGAEMVKLIIVAETSSTHNFHVNIKNGNDMVIKTKDIHFHHFFPKGCDQWW